MKAFLISTLLLSIFYSCSSPEKLEEVAGKINSIEIASDPIYHEYRLLNLDHQKNIGEKAYDIQSIQKLILENNWPDCNAKDKSVLASVRGGELYHNSLCLQKEAYDKLSQKYLGAFDSFERIKEISEIYNQSNSIYREKVMGIVNSAASMEKN